MSRFVRFSKWSQDEAVVLRPNNFCILDGPSSHLERARPLLPLLLPFSIESAYVLRVRPAVNLRQILRPDLYMFR